MSQLYDDQGNPVEAFTEEEVAEKIEEETKKAVETLTESSKKEIETAQEQVKALAKEKEDLQKKLEEEDPDKKGNFKKVRGALEAKDDQIEALTKKIDELSDGLGKKIEEITGSNKQASIKAEILAAVGGDKEAAKKVEIAYSKFSGEPTTPEELQERIQNSIRLVIDDKGRPLLNSSVFNASGGGKSASVAGKISDEVAEMARRSMGISEKELKKAKLI